MSEEERPLAHLNGVETLLRLARLEEKWAAREAAGEWTIDTLHDHITGVFHERDLRYEERDRRYEAQFRHVATSAASALSSQEKATQKAEDAQREYNVRSNEFRGQLDDQAKLLMPRVEAAVAFKALEEKLYDTRAVFEKGLEDHAKELASLRESRSEVGGKSSGASALWGYIIGALGLGMAGAALVAKLVSR